MSKNNTKVLDHYWGTAQEYRGRCPSKKCLATPMVLTDMSRYNVTNTLSHRTHKGTCIHGIGLNEGREI